MTFVLISQDEISLSFGNGYKEVFKCDGENASFWDNPTKFEKLENEQVYEVSNIEGNCQTNAWNRWKSILEQQNNEIECLVFEFRIVENPQLYNYHPNLPSKIVDCHSLVITGKPNAWLTFPVVQFMKPKIDSLHVYQIGYPYKLSTGFGRMKQVKTARKLYCTVAMEKEDVLELEGEDISVDSLYFYQFFGKEMLKKSIETGNPKKFRVFRGGKFLEGVLRGFEFSLWTDEIKKKYDFEYQIFPGCKCFLVWDPSYSRRLFVEFSNGRQDVWGCILNEK
ncbi:hypothetical protein CAEBREN_03791 [Caenorhabditis brenneri]|uniref:DUF38 domain-containing protein n=1 Tax=Caenorhabditis brenneri TaxID=135651 RepID=G0PBQ0_CAEBE|nr:hypothetical protein CAEBREN_03791 [Caenorhabditis brenneri]